MVLGEIDLGVRAEEARGEPFLRLAAIFSAPHLADEIVGQVVEQPVARLAHDFGVGRADLLAKLAQRGGARLLHPVDSALRHLPGVAVRIRALGDENETGGIEQHHAHAAPVADRGRNAARPRNAARLGNARAGHEPPLATALTGATAMPLRSSDLSHAARRVSVTA